MQIGERIRHFRKVNKLKLREVSERTGLSVSFISDVEVGRTMPSIETCQKFCNLYGTSLSQMFSGVEVDAPNKVCSRRVASAALVGECSTATRG